MGIASLVLALVSVGSIAAAFLINGDASMVLAIAGAVAAVLAVIFGVVGRRSAHPKLARAGLLIGALPVVAGLLAIPWLLIGEDHPPAPAATSAATEGSAER